MGGDDGAVIFRKLLRQGIPVLQGDGDEPHPGVAADILQHLLAFVSGIIMILLPL